MIVVLNIINTVLVLANTVVWYKIRQVRKEQTWKK